MSNKNKITTEMIKSPFGDSKDIKSYLLQKDSIPLSEFGYSNSNPLDTYAPAVVEGLDFLTERGYGTLEIPPISGVSNYVSYLDVAKSGSTVITKYRKAYNNRAREIAIGLYLALEDEFEGIRGTAVHCG